MKSILITLFAILMWCSPAISPEPAPWREIKKSPRIEKLEKEIKQGDSGAANRFWNEMKLQGTPLIEAIPEDRNHVQLTFLYRSQGSTKSVVLLAQLYVDDNRDDSLRVMTRLLDTDIWYKSYWIRSDMRFSYSFVPNPTPQSLGNNPDLHPGDPLNPKSLTTGTNVGNSVVELPDALPQRWIISDDHIPHGRIEEEQIESKVLKTSRRAWIYTPPGYDRSRESRYPLLVCFDGWVYSRAEFVATPTILDNLIAAKKIPAMIALFVDQAPQPQRNIELTNDDLFLEYVANELLAHVRQKWRITSDPSQTVVCGSSTGGLASAFFAFRRPDAFGNVLSQSGAFWPGRNRSDPQHEWLTTQIQSAPRVAVRFVLQVGILETGGPTPFNGPSILKTNRHLRDVLIAKGYPVDYQEVAGGHEPLSWRGGLAEGLISLMSAH